MINLTKLEIIKKIRDNEFSLEESINILSNDECWGFPNVTDKKQVKGTLSIFILKKILEFFPKKEEISNVKGKFERILKRMGTKTISLILKELEDYEKTGIEHNNVVKWEAPFSNNEIFNIFKKSATYIDIYNKINYLFSTLNLNEDIKLTEEEEEILKQKVLKKKGGHHKPLSYYKKKELDRKLDNHIKDLIFYAEILNKFYCSIFTKNYNIKDLNVILILPIDIENKLKKLNIDNLFKKCEKTEKFYLGLQNFMYKYKVDNIYLYLKRYEERTNFIKDIFYNIDNRYPHLMSEIIENKYPEFYKNTCNINSEIFAKALTFKKFKLKDIIERKKGIQVLKKSDDFIFIFYIKIWFEKILDISDWSSNYLHLDIFDKSLKIKEINGEFYPVIVNLFYTCWGVLYNGTLYIGNIIYVLFKYKEIIEEDFNLKLKKSSQTMKEISIKNFLIFKKK